MLQALAAVHGQGVVHGDVKPDNLRLGMREDGSHAKLVVVDLGSAVPTDTRKPHTSVRMLWALRASLILRSVLHPSWCYLTAHVMDVLCCAYRYQLQSADFVCCGQTWHQPMQHSVHEFGRVCQYKRLRCSLRHTKLMCAAASSNGVVFSPYYASPEALGRRADPAQNCLTGAADIWGLGCCFFELVTGCAAFIPAAAGGAALTNQQVLQGAMDRQDEAVSSSASPPLPATLLSLPTSPIRHVVLLVVLAL